MTSDVFSVLIHLQATAPDRSNGAVAPGYQAHAAFLDLLRQADPVLSQNLHDLNQRKPFTLSSLLAGEPDGGTRSNRAKFYQLRLTSLEAGLFETFISRFLGLDASSLRLRLGEEYFQVSRIVGNGNSSRWVGRSSFEQLSSVSPVRNWSFEFASPTAFSLGEQDWGGRKFVVFPDPGYVFDSLASCWNDFAPSGLLAIDKAALRQYIEKYVLVSSFKARTDLLNFKQHAQLGFVGTASYRLMEKQPSPQFSQILSSLAEFALYTGVGYKTTMGMGQTRLVEERRPTEETRVNKEEVRL